MKVYGLIFLLIISTHPFANSQLTFLPTDRLKQLLTKTGQDTNRIMLLAQLSVNYRFFNPDSSIVFAHEALQLAKDLDFPKGKTRALNTYGEARRFRGEFPQALEIQFMALQISKNSHYLEGEENSLGNIGQVYADLNDYRKALNYLYQAKKINESLSNKYTGSRWLSGIGNAYEKMNRLDSALLFQQKANAFSRLFPPSYGGTIVSVRLGVVQSRLGHFGVALGHFKDAIKSSFVTNDLVDRCRAQYQLADLYYSIKKPDSSLHYCRLAFANSKAIFLKRTTLDASSLLVKLYKERNNLDSAFHYQEMEMVIKDALYGGEKVEQLQLLALTQQQRQQQLREKQVQMQRIVLISALGVFLLIVLILWRNIRYQKRINQTLKEKNILIELQRNTLEETLTELKGTQSQLIQSEKMASLGELTAGIAHEIQNPLNFVNNFSELNTELITEMKEEIVKGNFQEVPSIADDIKENENRINLHGKRADAIVKGMLQHSRAGTGKKEPTDINALADEYLRLSYHGLKAKKNAFNAYFTTHFDKSIGNIDVVPQDMGRVLLNLYNNAFYSVNEKEKQLDGTFEPTVTITTIKLNGKVEIAIEDNGTGIPQKVLDKIYQPFFTTKPTGQGTGLGLSLSYDIIKAHGGELKVETTEGEGATFFITIPMSVS